MMPKRMFVCLVAWMLLAIPFLTHAQNKTITGVVLDSRDETPIIGATIMVKGSNLGSSTDIEGKFSISVPESAKSIEISAVNFATQTFAVSTSTNLVVRLQPAASDLNEVVVVGYGTQRRREVTGAIARVSSDKLNSIAAPSFEAGLQGKAPGVQVIQGSGLAGSGSVIRVRGIASISAGGDPLYVIDGVPIIADNFLRGNSGGMNLNPLASINPNDIESVEILKDAAATGIYGSRGSNGVILVTTKKGKSGKPRFNYNNKIGMVTYANRPDFLNSEEWLQIRQEAWINDGNTGLAPLPGTMTWDKAQQNNTDWWKELTRTGIVNDHSLSMTAGNKFAKTYLGVAYSHNESYIKKNSYTRMSVRSNTEFTITDRFKATLNLSYATGLNKRVPAAWAGGLGEAMSTALPIYPMKNDDGTWFTGGANPVKRMEETIWRNTDNKLLAGLNLNYEVIDNLFINVNGSYDYLTGYDDYWASAIEENRTDGTGRAARSAIRGQNWVTNATANYLWDASDNSRFNFLIGTEWQEKKYLNGFGVERFLDEPFYKNKDIYKNAIDSAVDAGVRRWNTSGAPETFVSVFARVNYMFKDRYAFQASIRRDGSSKFGENNKYGVFPTISFGWTITEENFMANVNFVDYLKFRTSYGLTGNSNIGSGLYYSGVSWGANYNGLRTLYVSTAGNPDLKWEETANFDAALEYGLFGNRLRGEIAFYHKHTTDLLLNSGVQPSSGFGSQMRNIAGSKVLNMGVEFSANYDVIVKKDLNLSIGGHIAKNYNELISLGGLDPDAAGGGSNDTRVAEGYPIGTNYINRFYGVDPTDGLPIWYDNEGKLTKTYSLDNRVPAGSVIPDFVGAFNHNLRYKGFEFSSLWAFTIGGNLYDGSGKRQAGIITDWNIRRDLLDRWQAPGDVAHFPRVTMNTNNYPGLSSEWQYNSTLFLYDASYLRLREMTIAYNVPAKGLERWKLRNLRVFVTGMNLLTFSKYPGGEPEIARDFENVTDRNLSPNITYLTTPQQKSVVFGLNVNF